MSGQISVAIYPLARPLSETPIRSSSHPHRQPSCHPQRPPNHRFLLTSPFFRGLFVSALRQSLVFSTEELCFACTPSATTTATTTTIAVAPAPSPFLFIGTPTETPSHFWPALPPRPRPALAPQTLVTSRLSAPLLPRLFPLTRPSPVSTYQHEALAAARGRLGHVVAFGCYVGCLWRHQRAGRRQEYAGWAAE